MVVWLRVEGFCVVKRLCIGTLFYLLDRYFQPIWTSGSMGASCRNFIILLSTRTFLYISKATIKCSLKQAHGFNISKWLKLEKFFRHIICQCFNIM